MILALLEKSSESLTLLLNSGSSKLAPNFMLNSTDHEISTAHKK